MTDSLEKTIISLQQVQEEHVRSVLELFKGNVTLTARALCVDRRTLYRMCERWKIDVSEFREEPTEARS